MSTTRWRRVGIRFQINSGSAVTLVPKCMITEIMKYSREESLKMTWEDIPSEYECYNDEVINLVCKVHATIRFGDCKTPPKNLYISEQNLATLGSCFLPSRPSSVFQLSEKKDFIPISLYRRRHLFWGLLKAFLYDSLRPKIMDKEYPTRHGISKLHLVVF